MIEPLFIVATGLGTLPTVLGPWAAPLLADAASPTNEQFGGWIMVLFVLCNGLVAILTIVAFFKPQPALHRQFAAREDHDKDVKEIKESVAAMRKDFEGWSTSHYEARRRMHRKINHISSAMAYLAGSMENTQPAMAARLRALIDKADEEDSDE